MRGHRLIRLGAVAALALVACGSDDKPTVGAGASTPTTMAMAETHMDHMGKPTSSCAPSGTTLSIVASGTKFDKDCLAAPASQTFSINYDNKDSTQHNFVILESHTASDVLYRADLIQGPKVQALTVGALKPGTYAFHCERHPNTMSGTFIVK